MRPHNVLYLITNVRLEKVIMKKLNFVHLKTFQKKAKMLLLYLQSTYVIVDAIN